MMRLHQNNSQKSKSSNKRQCRRKPHLLPKSSLLHMLPSQKLKSRIHLQVEMKNLLQKRRLKKLLRPRSPQLLLLKPKQKLRWCRAHQVKRNPLQTSLLLKMPKLHQKNLLHQQPKRNQLFPLRKSKNNSQARKRSLALRRKLLQKSKSKPVHRR